MKGSLLAATLVLASTGAIAQPATYTIVIEAKDVNLLGQALSKLPYGDVAPFFQNLSQQVLKQNEAWQSEQKKDEVKKEDKKK